MNEQRLPFVLAADPEGAVYAMIRKTFGNILPENIQPSFLWKEQILAAETSYSFDYTTKNSEPTANLLRQKNLKTNDLFVVTGTRMYIIARPVATPGVYRVLTYPNQQIVPATVLADPNTLQVLYNADLSLTTGKVTQPPIDTRQFYYVPQTQQTTAVNHDQQQFSDGLYLHHPRPVMAGNQTQFWKIDNINVNGGINLASIDEDVQLSVALVHIGYQLFNAAVYVVNDNITTLEKIQQLVALPDSDPLKQELAAALRNARK